MVQQRTTKGKLHTMLVIQELHNMKFVSAETPQAALSYGRGKRPIWGHSSFFAGAKHVCGRRAVSIEKMK